MGRAAVGFAFRPREVTFRHERTTPPGATARLERILQVAPRYGAPTTSVLIGDDDLRRPTVAADPGLHRVLLAHADTALERLPVDASASARVAEAVQKRLPSGTPKLEEVAAALAMSSRTLRRRLEEEQTTFVALVDQVRHQLALAYLQEDRLSLDEIAFLLGFSEARAFRRAFKRWTGVPPRARPS